MEKYVEIATLWAGEAWDSTASGLGAKGFRVCLDPMELPFWVLHVSFMHPEKDAFCWVQVGLFGFELF